MATKTHVSPTEIQKSLSGLEYPTDKQAIIKYAVKRGANQEMINALNNLPDKDYSNSAEVTAELEGDDSHEKDDPEEAPTM